MKKNRSRIGADMNLPNCHCFYQNFESQMADFVVVVFPLRLEMGKKKNRTIFIQFNSILMSSKCKRHKKESGTAIKNVHNKNAKSKSIFKKNLKK